MYIVSAFELSSHLELLISELEEKGLTKEEILAIPLDLRENSQQIIDTLHRSDGKSLMDGASIVGAIGMVLGSIYGFILTWGPILWGVIGLIAGGLIGLLLDKYRGKGALSLVGGNQPAAEVFLLINCKKHAGLEEPIKNLLWQHGALGMSKLFDDSKI
jgi:hypothetical protein